MRIVVCMKQVYDPKSIRISRSREELDLREAVRCTNRADRYALEAALRLRAAGGGEVIAVTAGTMQAEDTAHEAVAIGADRAMLVVPSRNGGPAPAAPRGAGATRAIAAAIAYLGPVDLVLTGYAGAVDGTGSLPGRLASALGWPVAIDVAWLSLGDNGLEAVVRTEDARGLVLDLPTPAVAAIIPGPERPRYAHAARIANAWQPGLVEICTAADLGLDEDALAPDTEFGALVPGPERLRGQMVASTADEAAGALVDILRTRRII